LEHSLSSLFNALGAGRWRTLNRLMVPGGLLFAILFYAKGGQFFASL